MSTANSTSQPFARRSSISLLRAAENLEAEAAHLNAEAAKYQPYSHAVAMYVKLSTQAWEVECRAKRIREALEARRRERLAKRSFVYKALAAQALVREGLGL